MSQHFSHSNTRPVFASYGPRTDVESPRLTVRESEVLGLVALGHTDREIATMLFISKTTASNHVSNILRKLNVATRTAAAISAMKAGML